MSNNQGAALKSTDWRSLPAEEVVRRLATLGLYLNAPESAIICTRCEYALQPSGARVTKHLGEKHRVPANARHGLSAFVDSLQLPDPNTLEVRDDGAIAHPHLAVRRGARCVQCNFRSTSSDLMHRHLSKEHAWKGASKYWYRDNTEGDLKFQSWSLNGQRRYWIVAPRRHASLGSPIPEVVNHSPRRRRVAAMYEAEEERLAHLRHDPAVTDTGIDDLAFISNWMRRTGWSVTFAGADRRLLVRLAQRPAARGEGLDLGHCGAQQLRSSVDDESHLRSVGHAIDRFTDRCEDTVSHTAHPLRCWLRSRDANTPHAAPFELPARNATQTRYRSCFKRLFFFVLRYVRLDDATKVKIRGPTLSDRQREQLALLWTVARAETSRMSPFTHGKAAVDAFG